MVGKQTILLDPRMRESNEDVATLMPGDAADRRLDKSHRTDVKIPAIFGSHMVLQQEAKVPIWGTADSGEKVTVSFAGQTVSTHAAADGRSDGCADADGRRATARTLLVTGKNALRLEDVLVGEVWVCSGQSNMVLQPAWTENGAQEIKAANFPRIRMITVPAITAQTPQKTFDGKLTPEDYDGQWAVCAPDVMKNFSAVGYFFGRQLHQRLDVPIGLIGATGAVRLLKLGRAKKF